MWEIMFDSLCLKACRSVLMCFREVIDCVIYSCCCFMMEFCVGDLVFWFKVLILEKENAF